MEVVEVVLEVEVVEVEKVAAFKNSTWQPRTVMGLKRRQVASVDSIYLSATSGRMLCEDPK